MTFRNAIAFFIQYGNLHGTLEECMKHWPTVTLTQIHNAADHARRFSGASMHEINEALVALVWRDE